jgi:hypothetical protein
MFSCFCLKLKGTLQSESRKLGDIRRKFWELVPTPGRLLSYEPTSFHLPIQLSSRTMKIFRTFPSHHDETAVSRGEVGDLLLSHFVTPSPSSGVGLI